MNEGERRPGPMLTWLAERLVPEEVRDDFVGDLIEEAGRRGPIRGRLWFATQLILSTPALVQLRLRRSSKGGRAVAFWAWLMAGLWLAADLLRWRAIWVPLCLIGAWLHAAGAVLIYRRTPFSLLAVATGVGAAEFLLWAAVFLVFPPARVVAHPAFWIVVAASFVGYGLSWLWSRRSHPDAWRRWKATAQETGMLGYLLFEHIPRMSTDTRR